MFRQNKRATDVHDIIGFRVIVFPESPKTRSAAATTDEGKGDTPAKLAGEAAGESKEKGHVDTMRGSNENRPAAGKKGGLKPARAVFTVKTFPPPYRDADSRLLHDVYEVLIGLFDEVPGRFKVGWNVTMNSLYFRVTPAIGREVKKGIIEAFLFQGQIDGRQQSMRPGRIVVAVLLPVSIRLGICALFFWE